MVINLNTILRTKVNAPDTPTDQKEVLIKKVAISLNVTLAIRVAAQVLAINLKDLTVVLATALNARLIKKKVLKENQKNFLLTAVSVPSTILIKMRRVN